MCRVRSEKVFAVLLPWLLLKIQLVAAVRRAWVRHRFASSILKPFSLCGLAPCSAASAAWRKVASVADLLVNAASASGERNTGSRDFGARNRKHHRCRCQREFVRRAIA